MAIKLGTTDINKIYLGGTQVNKVYLGETLVLGTDTGYDADAQAYITAHGNLTGAQEIVINDFFVSLKTGYATDIHSKLYAVWLPTFGNAVDDKWNLLNPLDTDAAFRLTFSGTVTHATDGIKSDASTGYADTHYVPTTDGMTLTNGSVGMYTSAGENESGATRVFVGCSGTSTNVWLGRMNAGTVTTAVIGGTGISAYTPVTANGIYINSQIASLTSGTRTNRYWHNGTTLLGTRTQEAAALPPYSIFLLANNNLGTANLFASLTKMQLAVVGDSLTETEVGNLHTSIQALINSINL